MSGSQHKKQEKARRKALKEKARQEEKRRNLITGMIVVAIVALGGLIVWWSIAGEGDAVSDDLTNDVSSEMDLPETPTEVVPMDSSVEPGEAVDSETAPEMDDRPVACGAEEPANAADSRPRYPGGPLAVLEDGESYTAVIETSCGTVKMDLLADAAPLTVNSFVFLADEGFFDGLEMFRNATSIGALQTGGGDQTNSWQIGYSIPDELELASTGGYPVGSVAMANAGPNSGGSQFFFVYNDAFDTAFEMQRAYAVFAQVSEGLDVLETIGAIPVEGETPTERVYMESVTIERS